MNPIEIADSLHAFQQTDLYKVLIEPLNEEREGLKASYDCKTLLEMAELKGLSKGLDRINQRMRQIETDAETARNQKKLEEERERRNHPPSDSSEL